MVGLVNKDSWDAYTKFKNSCKEKYESGMSIPDIADAWPIPAHAVAKALFDCGYGTLDHPGGTIEIDDILHSA